MKNFRHLEYFKMMGSNPALYGDYEGPEVLSELGAAAPSNSLASSRDTSKHELKNSMSPVQNF